MIVLDFLTFTRYLLEKIQLLIIRLKLPIFSFAPLKPAHGPLLKITPFNGIKTQIFYFLICSVLRLAENVANFKIRSTPANIFFLVER